MKDRKMSDIFELPMKVDGYSVESQPSIHAGCVIEFVSDIECDSAMDATYVAHAINNHDRMVEEIAELKSILKKFIPANDYYEDCEHDCVNHGGDFTYDDGSEHIGLEVVELLAKLNQEGEE